MDKIQNRKNIELYGSYFPDLPTDFWDLCDKIGLLGTFEGKLFNVGRNLEENNIFEIQKISPKMKKCSKSQFNFFKFSIYFCLSYFLIFQILVLIFSNHSIFEFFCAIVNMFLFFVLVKFLFLVKLVFL